MTGLLKKTLLWLLLLALVWLGGLLWFAAKIPATPADKKSAADAIVILTGSDNRLAYGLQLLTEHKAKAAFISGVGKGVTREILISRMPRELREDLRRMPESMIFLGSHAENTIGNAEETARWLADKNYKSILLVTSNFHMPRSVSEFHELMPEIMIVPVAVFSDNFTLSAWWRDRASRQMVLSEYHKYLASKVRHWLVTL